MTDPFADFDVPGLVAEFPLREKFTDGVETTLIVWGCGDEYCACSQVHVCVEGPNPFRGFLRLGLGEGPYHTDGETPLPDEVRAVARRFHIPVEGHKPGWEFSGKRPPTATERRMWEDMKRQHLIANGVQP